jgi:hypothetical protein
MAGGSMILESQRYIEKAGDEETHNNIIMGLGTAPPFNSNMLMLFGNETEPYDDPQLINQLNFNSTTHDLFHDVSPELTKFATGCCLLFILVGIPGNLLTIIALARCKKVRSIF